MSSFGALHASKFDHMWCFDERILMRLFSSSRDPPREKLESMLIGADVVAVREPTSTDIG
eukprot:437120-Rhodomonas_salina.4